MGAESRVQVSLIMLTSHADHTVVIGRVGLIKLDRATEVSPLYDQRHQTGDECVIGFEVAMEHPTGMHVSKAASELEEHVSRFFHGPLQQFHTRANMISRSWCRCIAQHTLEDDRVFT